MFGVLRLNVGTVCLDYLVSGVGILFGLVPFKTCPLFALMFVSSLSFSCCGDVRRRRFLFSLSLSGAGEKPLLGGLGFPLCLFFLAEHYAFNPYAKLRSYTKASPSPCVVFFFFSVVARLPIGMFLDWCGWVGFLGGWLSVGVF